MGPGGREEIVKKGGPGKWRQSLRERAEPGWAGVRGAEGEARDMRGGGVRHLGTQLRS